MCGEEAFTLTSMRQYTLIELFPVATSCPPLSVFIALQVDAQMVGILSKCTLTELLPVVTCMWQIHDIYHDISGGQSTQIKYLSKSTDTYTKILLQ